MAHITRPSPSCSTLRLLQIPIKHDNGDEDGPIIAGRTLGYEEYNEESELFENYLERFVVVVTTNSASRYDKRFVAKQCRCTGLHENQEPSQTGIPDRQTLR